VKPAGGKVNITSGDEMGTENEVLKEVPPVTEEALINGSAFRLLPSAKEDLPLKPILTVAGVCRFLLPYFLFFYLATIGTRTVFILSIP
jgi:hypothetical protein